MHIPDGYLSPATCGIMYAVSVPFWYLAVNRVRKVLTHRTVPVLALFAAFSFVLMMFNVPLPGGTTGHAVGGTLLAIVLGPWAAVLGISVALGIQALFFGDGGLITFGANCFNMAIVLPFVGYFIYKFISANSEATSPRRLIGSRNRQLCRHRRSFFGSRNRIRHSTGPIPRRRRHAPVCSL